MGKKGMGKILLLIQRIAGRTNKEYHQNNKMKYQKNINNTTMIIKTKY